MSMQTKGAYIDRERLSIIWNIDFATCVDKQGKRYNIALDYIKEIEDEFPA